MCEVFGVSSGKKINVNSELKEFFKHGELNPHGWGIASWDENGSVTLIKEPSNCIGSGKISELLSSDIKCRGMFAHIRRATIGQVEYENTHPFTGTDPNGRTWTLVHNGTIFESDELIPYVDVQKGDTDSERILLYILDQNEGVTDEAGRFELIDSIVVRLSEGNKLNLLIFDGENLYVHKNEAGTMYRKNGDGYVLFATKPLDEGAWEEVPINRLLVYRDGVQIYEGTVHDHTYLHDEKQMNMLLMSFAML